MCSDQPNATATHACEVPSSSLLLSFPLPPSLPHPSRSPLSIPPPSLTPPASPLHPPSRSPLPSPSSFPLPIQAFYFIAQLIADHNFTSITEKYNHLRKLNSTLYVPSVVEFAAANRTNTRRSVCVWGGGGQLRCMCMYLPVSECAYVCMLVCVCAGLRQRYWRLGRQRIYPTP